jgi:hypothetical protein
MASRFFGPKKPAADESLVQKGASGFVEGFLFELEAGPCSSRRCGMADKARDEA